MNKNNVTLNEWRNIQYDNQLKIMNEITDFINQKHLNHIEITRIYVTLLVNLLQQALERDEVLKSQIPEIKNKAMSRVVSFVNGNNGNKEVEILELKELFELATYLCIIIEHRCLIKELSNTCFFKRREEE